MLKYITQEGLDNLKKELEYLQTEKRKEIAERIRHAASFGDLSENAAYHEAKEAQAFLEGRIQELREMIRNAKVIQRVVAEKVQMGSMVEIAKDTESDNSKTEKYKIVGSVEANPLEGKISSDSPLGKSLLNLKKGDIFYVDTSARRIKYRIISIS